MGLECKRARIAGEDFQALICLEIVCEKLVAKLLRSNPPAKLLHPNFKLGHYSNAGMTALCDARVQQMTPVPKSAVRPHFLFPGHWAKICSGGQT